MAVPQGFPSTDAPIASVQSGRLLQPWYQFLYELWLRTGGSSGGGVGSVSSIDTIAQLQALTGATGTAYVLEGYYAAADGGGGIFVVDPLDTTSPDNGGTIIVDGDNNRWKRVFSGPASVQWFGTRGDGLTDDTGPIQAALDAYVDVFVPAGDFLITSISMGAYPGRKFRGAGSLATTIYSNAADGPAIICPSTIYYMEISGFYLERLGTAVAFDDGIQTLALLASPTITDVIVAHQYVGLRLQAADSGFFNQSYAIGCVSHGVLLANLPSGAGAGQVQWLLTDVFSSVNGGDGFRVEGTGTGPTQIALGTWTNCQSFANSGHGVGVVGQPGQPINGLRLQGGFFGEDGDSEIYLDSYGGGHVLQPSYLELAGTGLTGPALATPASHVGSGIQLTANNVSTEVKLGVSNGHSFDGLISACASLTVTGGAFQNNGLAGNASRANGIFLLAGTVSAAISGCRLSNIGGSAYQLFGLASNVDCVAMAGCDLRFNTSSWFAFSGGVPTNSNIAGCLPHEANITYAYTLHVLDQSAFAGNLNVTGVGTTIYVNDGSVVANVVQALSDVYTVNLTVSGTQTAASFAVGTLTVTTDLISTGQTHLTGTGIAMSGGVNITSGGMILSSVGGNGITVDNVTINTSLGVGVAATGVAGQIRANTDLISLGQLHITGQSAFADTLNITSGGIAMTTGVVGNGLVTDNIYARFSGGIGVAPSGTAGQFKVNTDLITLGQAHLTGSGGVAVSGGLNVTSGGAVFTNVGGNGLTVNNITVNTSLGVGTAATGVAGRIDSTSGVFGGTVSAAAFSGGSGSFSSVSSAGAISGTTITSSVDLIANGQFHGNSSSAFAAGLNVIGSVAVSAGVTAANITASTSIGVGLGAPGAYGVINVATAVQNNGTPYTFP